MGGWWVCEYDAMRCDVRDGVGVGGVGGIEGMGYTGARLRGVGW